MKRNHFLLIAATAAMALVGCNNSKLNMTNNEYPTMTVGTQNTDLQTTYPATIKGVQDVEIRPKVSGFITKLNVHEGQYVKAGQVLFVIDNVTYQAAVRQARAAVNSAKSQLNTAKLTYNNSQKLYAKNVIGSYELESAKNTYQTAQAAVAQAQANYLSAKQNLDFCYVVSPANGYIGSLPYKVGALVSSAIATPLTTVSNTSSMEIYFSMTEKDILALTKADGGIGTAIEKYPPVKLQLADGTIYPHEGKVTKASGVIDATTGSVSMIARFPNPEHLLKSGASGTIIVPRINNHAIVIPQNATTEVQNKIFVYVVGGNNKVKYTEITVDEQNDGKNYVVTGGLKVGDKIVTKGLTTLNDDMEIKPITEAQYEENIKKAAKLAEKQGTSKGFIDAMKK